MLKILMITGCVYAKKCGRKSFTGLDYVVGDIAEKIGEQSDVTVFTTTPYPKTSELPNAKIKSYSYVQLLPYINKEKTEILQILKKNNIKIREKIKLIRAVLLSELVTELCKNEHFDLISMQGVGHCNYILARAAKNMHIPILYSLHGLLSFGAPNIDYIDRIAEQELLKYIKHKSDTLTVVSEGIKKQICEKYDIDQQFVCVFNNAVKIGVNNGEICSKEHEHIKDDINIISVGTLCENKNQIQLIRAYELLPEEIKNKCKISLVGKDETNGEIEKYIVDNHLEESIKICGFLSKQEVAKLYLSSTFNVMLSISEGFGLSMIEAAYCGIPTLTFDDLDAAHDIYSEDSMILLRERSDEAVCAGLLDMIDKKWNAEKIRESVKQFNTDNYLQYLQKYEELCANKNNIIDIDFLDNLLRKI